MWLNVLCPCKQSGCGYGWFSPGLLFIPTHAHHIHMQPRAGGGHTGIEMNVQTGLCWPHVWACLSLLLVHMPNAGSKSLALQSQGTWKMLAQLKRNKIFPATALWEGQQLPCAAAGSQVLQCSLTAEFSQGICNHGVWGCHPDMQEGKLCSHLPLIAVGNTVETLGGGAS